MGDPLFGQLRDVNEPFDVLIEASKGAEISDFGNRAGHQLPDLIALLHGAPGLGLQALDTQCDATALAVNAENIDLELLASFEHLAGMLDMPPRKLGQVDQTVCPTQVDKSAKVTQATHHAIANLAFLQFA